MLWKFEVNTAKVGNRLKFRRTHFCIQFYFGNLGLHPINFFCYPVCHLSHDTFFLSKAICHLSPVTCHLSPIPFHLSPFTYNIAHFTCPMSIVTLPLSHVIYHLSPVTTAPQSGYLGYLRYQKIILLFSLEITFKVPQKRVFLKELCSFTETSYCVTKTVSDGN